MSDFTMMFTALFSGLAVGGVIRIVRFSLPSRHR